MRGVGERLGVEPSFHDRLLRRRRTAWYVRQPGAHAVQRQGYSTPNKNLISSESDAFHPSRLLDRVITVVDSQRN